MKTVRILYQKTFEQMDAFVGRMSESERMKFSDQAYADAQAAAFAIGYLNERGCAGCGDNGHDDARRTGERLRKSVRRAIGFTRP